MAQSEDEGLSREEEQGTTEVEAQQADAETGEPEEGPKNGLLFVFAHRFRLIQGQESATASLLAHADHPENRIAQH